MTANHCISIHALREEGDSTVSTANTPQSNFYPRPPRGGRHSSPPMIFTSTMDFYPRPPRGGRRRRQRLPRGSPYFYPRPPRGGRPRVLFLFGAMSNFYPRPPRGGRRTARQTLLLCTAFLSTPSARRATKRRPPPSVPEWISIHALREEGDSKNRDKISIFKQIIQHSARI